MNPTHPFAVWIDHHEARIFRVGPERGDASVIVAPRHHVHRHPKGPYTEHAHPDDAHRFFRDVAEALRDAAQILVMGPSTAKLQLLRYLREHSHAIEQKVVGIETVDHPTDRQLIAHATRYFDLKESGTAGP